MKYLSTGIYIVLLAGSAVLIAIGVWNNQAWADSTTQAVQIAALTGGLGGQQGTRCHHHSSPGSEPAAPSNSQEQKGAIKSFTYHFRTISSGPGEKPKDPPRVWDNNGDTHFSTVTVNWEVTDMTSLALSIQDSTGKYYEPNLGQQLETAGPYPITSGGPKYGMNIRLTKPETYTITLILNGSINSTSFTVQKVAGPKP